MYVRGVVELEVDVLNDECPHFVAETVSVQVALYFVSLSCSAYPEQATASTLKLSLALTFSANTSATTRSKVASTLSATCGSMRPSVMKLSRASVSAEPMLVWLSHGDLLMASMCPAE